MSLRVGHGVDAHRLVEGRPLMLGCVAIPHERGLAGHSDGDVLVHALCDALLGAAGLGDMGHHFPSGDSRWSGTAGSDFLRAVAALLAAADVAVLSAHAVVIAEEPRIAPHLVAMRDACAGGLGVVAGTVQLTATTTDGMGFTGERAGIAASAVALVEVHTG